MGTSFLKFRHKESRISKFMKFCNNIQELLSTRERSSDQDWMRLLTFWTVFRQWNI